MAKLEQALLFYLTGMRYKPDIEVELRPDRKRLVIRQGGGEDENQIWIDLGDVAALCEVLQEIVKTVRLTRVVEDARLDR